MYFPRGSYIDFYNNPTFKFQALKWEGYDTGALTRWSDNREYTIYVSGVDEVGNSVVLKTRFNPWIMVKLPKGMTPSTFVDDTLLRKDEDKTEEQIEKLGPNDSHKKERYYLATERDEPKQFAKYLDSYLNYEIVE